MEKKNNQNNPKNTNEQKLFLENKNRKIRSKGKLNTPRAEEGHCNDQLTVDRPLTVKDINPKIYPKIHK